MHAHDESFVERSRSIGGMPRIGHMIRLLRSKDPGHTLVIDAGDIFQGTPLFTKYHGETEVNMLNKMGYDIYTIGNHEFDDGAKNLAAQLRLAKFDIISANMDCASEPELAALVKPSVIKEIDGQKIAFIGGITPELASVALNTGGVKVKAPGGNWLQPFIDEINKVKAAGVNKIILVTHCGVDYDKALAEGLPDVDAIIGGHSHTRLDKAIVVDHPDGTTTTIVQTGCYGRALGKLDLRFDDKGKVIATSTQYRLINITDKILDEPDLKAYVDEKVKPLLGLRHDIVGQAADVFDNKFRTMAWDSALGDLITDAVVEGGKEYGVQIGLENRGGIRSRIEKGPISEEKLEEMLPFDNHLTFATISGATLLKTLEHSFAGPLGGSFLDEHGIKVAWDPSKPRGNRVVFALVRDDKNIWKPIDPQEKYKIGINDFSFNAGEGFDFSSAENIQRTPDKLSLMLRHYLKKHNDVAPQPPSRIVPITADLAKIESEGNDRFVNIKGVVPNSKITIVSGTDQGVSPILDKIPTPLTDAKIVETGIKATAEGRAHVKLTEKLDQKGGGSKWICIIAEPPATAPAGGKRTLISYPLPLD